MRRTRRKWCKDEEDGKDGVGICEECGGDLDEEGWTAYPGMPD